MHFTSTRAAHGGGCSIGGPDEETQHVIELISKIDDVSLQTAATIETASDAFDQLDENQKIRLKTGTN
ncbi:MAG: hypothetical protein MSA17_07410 [Collinsella sp.]|nr:hypothetical protein [Collinsella sp.]MDY3752675.1 hypothetical protein [Collinsella sp.]